MSHGKKTALGLILPVSILLLWHLATTYTDVPQSILPSLESVWRGFLELAESGQLWTDLSISLMRVVKGFLLAGGAGVLIGALMGMMPIFRAMLSPMLTALRQIPMIAWTPLVILWFGIGEKSKVVMIFIAAFFPVLLNTYNGITSTPEHFLEVAALYRMGPWRTFFRVCCPHALPQILVGLKLGLSISWMSLIAAELIAGTSGIGYRMSNARALIHSNVVIVCMVVIGLVGVLMDRGVTLLFRALTPWEKGGGRE